MRSTAASMRPLAALPTGRRMRAFAAETPRLQVAVRAESEDRDRGDQASLSLKLLCF